MHLPRAIRNLIKKMVLPLTLMLLSAFATTPAFPATPSIETAVPFVEEHSQAEYSVIGYINAYRYRDFAAVGNFDAVISAAIEKQLIPTSQVYSGPTEAMKHELEAIQRYEQEKLAGTTANPFASSRKSPQALRPLYQALYPGIRFKIIKATSSNRKSSDTDVAVELNYSDRGHAPKHNGKPVSSAIVRVYLNAWKSSPKYRVLGYRPTVRGVKFF
jgi:hypothetical protein